MNSSKTKQIPLELIRIDGGTQPRVAIDEQIVAEYAELYGADIDLPPVTVFFDGAAYWLADGFHRYYANKQIKRECVPADVHEGLRRDAVLYSVGANAAHGLRRTNADKRKAVLTMLEDEQWSQWSNRETARRCGVGETMVRRTRENLAAIEARSQQEGHTAPKAQYESCERVFTHPKTGKPARMKTATINHGRGAGSPNPVRQPRPALAQANINLPHDPVHGARAIVSVMGEGYARELINSLTTCLKDLKEGDS